MKYEHIVNAVFLRRPNRFLAHAAVNEREVVCHVKNTGRLKELLLPGCRLLLQHHPDAAAQGRKTSYSLVGAYKEHALGEDREILVNIDSQSPNRIAEEWLENGELKGVSEIRREVVYGSSRFDLAFKRNGAPAFMEVKGVTLERDGIAMFPDAPTERGVKHLNELAQAVKDGYEAYVLFVIQHDGVKGFAPNRETHPEFADALREAKAAGVKVLAHECEVKLEGTELEVRLAREVVVGE